ncbi:MAG: RNA polymerase sigma-70 factor [Odoribacter sp.]|nr:RNA polymerase sigma-70 factor [Odoribacter sp.]
MENNLIYRLQQKDRRAYMELYDTYFKRLHRFALNFVFDYEVANNIVQVVFISLYENIAHLNLNVNLGGYLMTMVRNRSLNYLRDRAVEDRYKILYLEAVEQTETLEWLDDEELIEKLRNIIEKLPEKYRQICELRFYRNMKYSEIADSLSISETNAKVQVHRALQKIKEFLADEDFQIIALLALFEKSPQASSVLSL